MTTTEKTPLVLPEAVHPSPRSDAKKHHFDYLDGVRALAALFIIVHHTRVMTLGISNSIVDFPNRWMLYGHLAVDVFIVLSGFCLILPVASTGYLRGGSWQFYMKRARRILPPMLASLIFSLIITHFIAYPTQDWHSAHAIWHSARTKVVLTNVFLLQDLKPYYNILNVPLWSVAVEWKIYFLFPLFVLLWKRSRIAVVTVAAIIGYGVTFLLQHMNFGTSLGHTCPWYVVLFTFGVCAGGAAVNDQKSTSAHKLWSWGACFSALALVALLMRFPMTASGEEELFVPHEPLTDAICGALTACILYLLYRLQQQGKRHVALTLLSWPPLVRIGTFAYSIYLFHGWLIWTFIWFIRSHWHLGMNRLFVLTIAMGAPLTIAICYVFFLAVERPFLVRRRKEKMDDVARDAALSPAP